MAVAFRGAPDLWGLKGRPTGKTPETTPICLGRAPKQDQPPASRVDLLHALEVPLAGLARH